MKNINEIKQVNLKQNDIDLIINFKGENGIETRCFKYQDSTSSLTGYKEIQFCMLDVLREEENYFENIQLISNEGEFFETSDFSKRDINFDNDLWEIYEKSTSVQDSIYSVCYLD